MILQNMFFLSHCNNLVGKKNDKPLQINSSNSCHMLELTIVLLSALISQIQCSNMMTKDDDVQVQRKRKITSM